MKNDRNQTNSCAEITCTVVNHYAYCNSSNTAMQQATVSTAYLQSAKIFLEPQKIQCYTLIHLNNHYREQDKQAF